MKLYWSPSAPFVRKVLICAHELGLRGGIETVRAAVGPTRLDPTVLKDNPLNKVPALVLESGEVLYDSRVICEYLDDLGGGDLFPSDRARRWTALRRQAMADGAVDAFILLRDDVYRGARHCSPAHVAAYTTKIQTALDHAEADAAALDTSPFDVGHVSLGCALSYFDFRPGIAGWRDGRPALADWYLNFEARPAAKATELSGEGLPASFSYTFPQDDTHSSTGRSV